MRQQESPTLEFRSVRQRPRRFRKVGKVALIIGVILAVLLGGTVLYVNSYIHGKFNKTHQNIAVDPLPPGQSYNILVLGSDRGDVVDPSQRNQRQFRGRSGQRADTILLIHVPADQKSAVILSFPRDLRVKIPGTSGYSKINAAYNNGPDKMIQTIKSVSGLSVNHYVEVNFAAFQKVVDAVGGVKLCVDRAYDDRESGLIIPKPGCYTFNGSLALSYVRMRKQDPRGDFGRIQRQQEFMRVLMTKVTSIGFLTDLPRLLKLADAVSKGVITDQTLELKEIRGIANKLAGFKQSKVDFRVVPSHSQYISGTSYVVAEEKEAQAVYAALKNDTPLPPYGKTGASIPQPSDVTVTVLNGTTKEGFANTVADQLKAKGYKVTAKGNAPRRDYKTTTVIFTPGLEAKAQLIQEEFPGSEGQPATSPIGTDVQVILGADALARASPAPR